MARRLRYGLAGRLVEITCRTLQGRFLVRPSSFVNVAVKGTLGRAQRYYGLRICAAVFLSNHYHLLVVPESEEQLKAFMRFLNSNLARQLGRLHDWPEKMWPQGYKAIPISDEPEAQMAKLRYVLEHGVKENLVEKPGDWPGVQCVHELRTGAWPKVRKEPEKSGNERRSPLIGPGAHPSHVRWPDDCAMDSPDDS